MTKLSEKILKKIMQDTDISKSEIKRYIKCISDSPGIKSISVGMSKDEIENMVAMTAAKLYDVDVGDLVKSYRKQKQYPKKKKEGV